MKPTKFPPWAAPFIALVVALSPCHLLTLSSAEAAEADADIAILQAAGIPTDGPGLAAYIRQRTVTVADEAHIKVLVRQLGDDEFKARERASRQLVKLGSRVRPFLQAALKDDDPEIARRARDCLERIAKETSASALAAAVRVLARRSQAEPGNDKIHAAAVLLDYLPSAEADHVVETIRKVLPSLAVPNGKAEPALIAALTDKSPLKRAAAGAALARAHAPDAMPSVRKLLKDRDAHVRLHVGLALAASADKDAMPALIRLLDELPWRDVDPIINLLEQLAGANMPEVVYGANADAHRAYRRAWEAWWKEHQAKIAPDSLEKALRLRGVTLVVLLDAGTIEDLDAANQIRWKIDNVAKPLDVQLLPGEQRLLIAEHDANRVSERDLKGEIVWQKTIDGPLMAQRLANGNTFIATVNQLLEIDKDGKEVFRYSRPDGGHFMRAAKLRDGGIACVVVLGGALTRYVRLTPTGNGFKEVKSWGVAVRTSGGRINVLPNGHVLIPEMYNNRVVEYDADGRIVWKVQVDQPIAAVRLANGNTLVTLMRQNRAVELDREGKEIWQFKADSRVTRAFRR